MCLFTVLWILTVFPIFNKMDDISARQSEGWDRETVALSGDDSITIYARRVTVLTVLVVEVTFKVKCQTNNYRLSYVRIGCSSLSFVTNCRAPGQAMRRCNLVLYGFFGGIFHRTNN